MENCNPRSFPMDDVLRKAILLGLLHVLKGIWLGSNPHHILLQTAGCQPFLI